VLEEAEKWRYLSFLERKNLLVQLLKHWKCRTNSVMRGSNVEECVLNIGKLLKESTVNRKNNDTKQTDIEAGRRRQNRPAKKQSQYNLSMGRSVD
jgi:hypothetical protein